MLAQCPAGNEGSGSPPPCSPLLPSSAEQRALWFMPLSQGQYKKQIFTTKPLGIQESKQFSILSLFFFFFWNNGMVNMCSMESDSLGLNPSSVISQEA